MFGHKSFLRIGELTDASITGLYRDGYELDRCNYGFSQNVNSDGKAQSGVRGGQINVTIPGIPPMDVIEWSLGSRKYHSGAIVLCDDDDMPLEKVYFTDAACTGMEITCSQKGKGYIATKLTLQARKMAVGETELDNRWTGFDGAVHRIQSGSSKVVSGEMFSFPKIDSDLEMWFVIEGKEYEPAQFSISFGQGSDYKGQPQDEVRGGRILLTLSEAVPDNIYRWAMSSITKDGLVEFRSKTSNAPLKIEFMNAFCVNMERIIDAHAGLYTALMISPEEITINGISFDNKWVR
jgi:hypothetical protein